MALSVQTNNAAVTALKHLNTNSMNMNKSLERLSSGFRINSAADDAAGFAISSKLDSQNVRLKAAALNATQAQAMVKTADAGVNEIQNMVVRLQSLATQAMSANNGGELASLDAERGKLESAINKIAANTEYNGTKLLNGSAGTAITGVSTVDDTTTNGISSIAVNGAASNTAFTITYLDQTGVTNTFQAGDAIQIFDGTTTSAVTIATLPADQATQTVSVGGFDITINSSIVGKTTGAGTGSVASTGTLVTDTGASSVFQVGAATGVDNQVSVAFSNSYTTAGLGISGTNALTSVGGATAYAGELANALSSLVTKRADLGATQNQLSFVAANLATSIEQATASVSSIRDADMAAEMANFTKNQILTQAGTSMLAQANQAAQNVLSLFR
ncbi:flagellar protein [Mariprofundus sp. NF]|uniref:flagellin N-terminal helical domain-containing protein n=1 Tax=Mariprofundus sp. NF TaxID=2608716 RepID=UPI0015A164C5|nr:flagellin [Mariprofundus sp. NF]NWF38578.1 flagellar protein [Mariprofundus sp. NF]